MSANAAPVIQLDAYRKRREVQKPASSSAIPYVWIWVNIWLPVLRQPPAGAGSPSALESFIAQVVSSVEYLQAQKDPGTNPPTYSNASWVESIYVKVLGRASDPAAPRRETWTWSTSPWSARPWWRPRRPG